MPTPRTLLALAAAGLAVLTGCTGTATGPTDGTSTASSTAEVTPSATTTEESATPSTDATGSTGTTPAPATDSPTPATASATPTTTAPGLAALATAPVPARCDGPGGRLVGYTIHGSEGSPFEGILMHGQPMAPGNRTTPRTVVTDLDGDGTPELASGYWCDNADGPYADAVLVHDATGQRLVAWLDLAAVAPTARLRTLVADGRTLRLVTAVGDTATNHTVTLAGGRLLLDGRSPAAVPSPSAPASSHAVVVAGPADVAKLPDKALGTLALARIAKLREYSGGIAPTVALEQYDPAGTATVTVTGAEGWREVWGRRPDGTWVVLSARDDQLPSCAAVRATGAHVNPLMLGPCTDARGRAVRYTP